MDKKDPYEDIELDEDEIESVSSEKEESMDFFYLSSIFWITTHHLKLESLPSKKAERLITTAEKAIVQYA